MAWMISLRKRIENVLRKALRRLPISLIDAGFTGLNKTLTGVTTVGDRLTVDVNSQHARVPLPFLTLPLLARVRGAAWLLVKSIFDVYQIMRDNCDMSVDPKTISLTDAQRKALAELSNKSGKPWPEVFTEALSTYRPRKDTNGKNGKSFADAANRLGLVGCVEGPADLSTNPAHMEGFGQSEK